MDKTERGSRHWRLLSLLLCSGRAPCASQCAAGGVLESLIRGRVLTTRAAREPSPGRWFAHMPVDRQRRTTSMHLRLCQDIARRFGDLFPS